ncbi:SRPBCC family protein [Kribbella deserti]|uniref:SRPBCC family protein n=1 Tax=Kribbella deserti TaxID=1926257 RepID=A0ABV6QPM0_9ACTN
MRFEHRFPVNVPAERVWEVYSDVERWPEWTASITSVERLDPGPLRVGARTRIKQPRLPEAIWTVTEWQPDEYFAWVSTVPGIRTTAGHRVEPTATGALVTASVDQSGPLGPLFAVLLRGLTNRYLSLEATGLQTRCESR